MGAIKRTGAVVVRNVSYLFSLEHIRQGFGLVRVQWSRATKRVCPGCQSGRLFPFSEIVEGQPRRFLGCNFCDHYQAADLSVDPASTKRLQHLAAIQTASLSPEDLATLIARYRKRSRWHYFFSVAAICWSIYLLCTGAMAWSFLNAMVIALLMFVQGLVASYRNWQLLNSRLYVPGSFFEWLKAGQWLV